MRTVQLIVERSPLPPTPLIHTDAELVDHVRGSADMRNWYTKHRATMHTMFGEHAPAFSLALAATSPRNRVGGNVSAAIRAMHQIKFRLPFDGGLRMYANNLGVLRDGLEHGDSAATIARRFGGPKVGQYTRAMMGDHGATAIDMHVSSLLWGKPEPTDREHREGREHVTRIAGLVGWTPRQTQAAMWAANQRKIGQTPSTYEDHLMRPEVAERARRVLSAKSPLPEFEHRVTESADPHGADGLGDLLLNDLMDDPDMAAPLPQLALPLTGKHGAALQRHERVPGADLPASAVGSAPCTGSAGTGTPPG